MSDKVMAVCSLPLVDGFGMTLLCDCHGWRFGGWHKFGNLQIAPMPTEADRQRYFATTEEAAAYFTDHYAARLRSE